MGGRRIGRGRGRSSRSVTTPARALLAKSMAQVITLGNATGRNTTVRNSSIVARTAPGGRRRTDAQKKKPGKNKTRSTTSDHHPLLAHGMTNRQAAGPKLPPDAIKLLFDNPASCEHLPPLPPFMDDAERMKYVWREFDLITRLWKEFAADPRSLPDYVEGLEKYREGRMVALGEKKDFAEVTEADYYDFRKSNFRKEKDEKLKVLHTTLQKRYNLDKLPPPKPPMPVKEAVPQRGPECAPGPSSQRTNQQTTRHAEPVAGPSWAYEGATGAEESESEEASDASSYSSDEDSEFASGAESDDGGHPQSRVASPPSSRDRTGVGRSASRPSSAGSAESAGESVSSDLAEIDNDHSGDVSEQSHEPVQKKSKMESNHALRNAPQPRAFELVDISDDTIPYQATPTQKREIKPTPLDLLNTARQKYTDEDKRFADLPLPEHLNKIAWRCASILTDVENKTTLPLYCERIGHVRRCLLRWYKKVKCLKDPYQRFLKSCDRKRWREMKDSDAILSSLVDVLDGIDSPSVMFVQQMIRDYLERANDEAIAEDEKKAPAVEHILLDSDEDEETVNAPRQAGVNQNVNQATEQNSFSGNGVAQPQVDPVAAQSIKQQNEEQSEVDQKPALDGPLINIDRVPVHSYGETPPSNIQLAKTKHVSRSHANLSASTPAILTGTVTSSTSSSSCGSAGLSGSSFLTKSHNFNPTTLTYYNNNRNVFGSSGSFFSTTSSSANQKAARAKSFLFRPGSSATLPSQSSSSSTSSMTRHRRHAASVKAPHIPNVNSGSTHQVPAGHHRAPNPRKMAVVADALSVGLAACVSAAQEDVVKLREIVECGKAAGGLEPRAGKLFESERELKRAEHELKLGELARSQVERLFEEYNIQGRLREGARAMAAAFANGPSMRRKGSAVDRVRSGYWECVNTMSELEAQLEGMVGMFHCQIQGIQGFARLCPGDVFELSFRHSRQKWKTRGRVCKDGSQTWDHPRASFKAVCFAEDAGMDGEYVPGSGAAGSPAVLTVKAREIKRGPLGQKVLLGKQDCDLLRLMAPRPIALSLPLNQSGSLKLAMLIVWRPLDCSLLNGTLGMSTQLLATLPSSVSTSALPLVGRTSNGSALFDHDRHHHHWPHQTSSGSAGSSTNSGKYPSDEENTGSSNRSTDDYFDEGHDSYDAGDGSSGGGTGDRRRNNKLNNLNNNVNKGRRRHESLPMSESSDRDNLTLSSSSLSRNTGSSSRDDGSSYANTMSWSGSDSHGTLDRGSAEATDDCSSCMSSSVRSGRSASISHPPKSSAPVPPERKFGLPSGKVIPSDPLDLNFTLTKRPDWGLSFGLKDRFMARSCPAVDLIATEEEDEEEEDEDTIPSQRQPLGQVVEESLVDGDGDDSEEELPAENGKMSSRLLELMAKVVANVEDLRGRFCQLIDFETQVDRLNVLLDNCGGKNSAPIHRRNSKDSMAAIERVLECFDFLDKELDGFDDDEKKRHSVILGSVTGDVEIDSALEIHLDAISRLLGDLGSFGPLKEREARAIAELSRQAFALRVLLDFSNSESSSDSTQWKFSDGDASAVWRSIPRRNREKAGTSFLASKQDVVTALTPKALDFWRGGEDRLGPFLEFVFQRISGGAAGSFGDSTQMTVFQFRNFFTGKLVVPCLLELAKEYDLICDISGSNSEYDELDRKGKSKTERRRKEALTSMMSMKKAPPAGAVLAASHLLCMPTTVGCDLARRYFASVVTHHPPPVRNAVEKVLLEALESKVERDREGGCRGLTIIGPGSKAIAPLAFLANSDPSHAVRRASKEALILMGEEGQNALTQAVLSSHGFQGLCVP